MRGPIEYIVVEFIDNKFDGSILAEIEKASDAGIIKVLDLALLSKDENGEVTALSVEDAGDEVITTFISSNGVTGDLIGDDDIDEIAEMLENNSSTGILVVEMIWAKPLVESIVNANGILLAEGRIHPDAFEELNN